MDYETRQRIGEGGFGIVDEVCDNNGNRFAKKTLNLKAQPQHLADDIRARFRREVKYQSTINHPNVVKIYQSDLDDDPPWFVMELAECSLADEMESDQNLTPDKRQALFDILNGLQAIHSKGYKHRDLKPQNVLKIKDPDGKSRYAISDFGLMAPADGQTTTLTVPNAGGGTPLYSAPECVRNLKQVTRLADIYSFGAILHDIFSGNPNDRLPYEELTAEGSLKKVVETCTRRQPRRRYQSVEQLREALYEALEVLKDADVQDAQIASGKEKAIVSLLTGGETLSDEEWNRVFDCIDENADAGSSNDSIFRSISVKHIAALHENSPELFESLGKDYARYASEGTFAFEYCDVIGSKAWKFYKLGGTELKALIALAMLQLGTSHNRWYVEELFMRMASTSIPDELAERIAVEADVQNIDFERGISHIEKSIEEVSRKNLHPILVAIITEEET